MAKCQCGHLAPLPVASLIKRCGELLPIETAMFNVKCSACSKTRTTEAKLLRLERQRLWGVRVRCTE